MGTTRLTFLFDGACAICAAEAARLRRWNVGKATLRFVDISAAGFDPTPYGKTIAELMGRVHALRPDGKVLIGMDAIRAAYEEVGLGWLLRPTAWRGLRPLFDRFYLWFARNRYRLSRRVRCDDGRCAS